MAREACVMARLRNESLEVSPVGMESSLLAIASVVRSYGPPGAVAVAGTRTVVIASTDKDQYSATTLVAVVPVAFT